MTSGVSLLLREKIIGANQTGRKPEITRKTERDARVGLMALPSILTVGRIVRAASAHEVNTVLCAHPEITCCSSQLSLSLDQISAAAPPAQLKQSKNHPRRAPRLPQTGRHPMSRQLPECGHLPEAVATIRGS